MNPSVTLHYTPDQNDYAAVLRLFYWQRTSTKIFMAFLAAGFGLVFCVLLFGGKTASIYELIWLIVPPLFVIYTFYYQPRRTARFAAQNEQLIAEATWVVNEDGVQIMSRFDKLNLGWDSLSRLVTTRDYYLLLNKSNKNSFRFLPRRAFTSAQEEEVFLELAGQFIRKP